MSSDAMVDVFDRNTAVVALDTKHLLFPSCPRGVVHVLPFRVQVMLFPSCPRGVVPILVFPVHVVLFASFCQSHLSLLVAVGVVPT
jgi:hypothetical protein